MNFRWPWRRAERAPQENPVTNSGEAILVRDVNRLAGDETMNLGGGMFVNVADLLDFNVGTIPVHREEGL